jgi:large subunit ribosomal protein L18
VKKKKVSKKIPINQRSHERRKRRISFSTRGTDERPRLAIFRSNAGFYAQVIDDTKRSTLVAIASNEKEFKGKLKNDKEGIFKLGEALAKRAVTKKVEAVVFDRAGYLYHGKVKAFADGARAGGLKF